MKETFYKCKNKIVALRQKLKDTGVLIVIAITLVLGILIGYSMSGKSYIKEQYEIVSAENSTLTSTLDETTSKLKTTTDEYSAYKEKMQPYEQVQLTDAQNAAEAEKLRIEQENQAKAEKAAAEKAAAEKAAAEAAAAKAAEEAKGYETGITYDQLARTPDSYKGQKVKFKGKVVQVLEGSTDTQIRLAVNGNYNNILYCSVPKAKTANTRILEDDYITIMGKSLGLISYQSTMGGTITIPSISVDDWGPN